MVETGAMRQVALAQGLMAIDGVPEHFVQGIGRHLRLAAEGLHRVGGFTSRDGRLDDATRILGRATLRGDSLHRAGLAGKAGEIALTIRPLAEGEDGRILLVVGFDEAEDGSGSFRADILLPAAAFATLGHDVQSGEAQALSLSATTSLWVRESERAAVPGLPVAWHLGWEPDGHLSTPAGGLVETLEWHAAPSPHAPTATSTDEDHADTAGDQLAAINWSLKQVVLALVFLLIVVALK